MPVSARTLARNAVEEAQQAGIEAVHAVESRNRFPRFFKDSYILDDINCHGLDYSLAALTAEGLRIVEHGRLFVERQETSVTEVSLIRGLRIIWEWSVGQPEPFLEVFRDWLLDEGYYVKIISHSNGGNRCKLVRVTRITYINPYLPNNE